MTQEEVRRSPVALDIWMEGEPTGAWIRVRAEPSGRMKVSIQPHDGTDSDLMGRAGKPEAGSMQCSFEMGSRRYDASVEWDDSMVPTRLWLRSGDGKPGAHMTERHEAAGRSYTLERQRVYRDRAAIDVAVDLRLAP